VHTPFLILGAWVAGGVIALIGAFIYAELAERLPRVGGQYAYLRDAYNPLLAFLYGWVLLLVIQSGGMAVVAVTFARYFSELTGTALPDWFIAIVALALLTLANCLGVRTGSTVQSALMVMKIAAVLFLIVAGIVFVRGGQFAVTPILDRPLSPGLLSAFGGALVPVLFAYGGWQTASFIAAELKDPKRDLPRGLLLGVAGVVILYTGVNFVCLRTLGPAGLAATHTPASAAMRVALGQTGATVIALGIAISTLGFLSQSVLTAPRVYFAMAEDGVFFRSVAWVHPRTKAPVIAIVVQSVWTVVILLSGRYEQILSYVVCMDWIFFGLSASCLFVFRDRDPVSAKSRVPGHPFTTAAFCMVALLVVLNTVYRYPVNTAAGLAILASGVPVYYLWNSRKQGRTVLRAAPPAKYRR
jgi:APA family basic amino acid/polyamine antiporter